MEIFNLWLLYKFFYSELKGATHLALPHLSLGQKIQILQKTYPSTVIKYLAHKEVQKICNKTDYNTIPLPWRHFDKWPEILDIFKLQPGLPGGNILFQLALLSSWGFLISYIIVLPKVMIAFVGLLTTTVLSLLTYAINLSETLYLSSVYLWSQNKPLEYIWFENKSYPKCLKPKYFSKWQSIDKLYTTDYHAAEQLLWALRHDITFKMLGRNRLTYSMILFVFFSCTIIIGQDFFEHLYSKNNIIMSL